MLSRDSEDEFDQDLCLNFVIWPQEVTLIIWTRPSGPLCLWQCSICSLLPLLVVIFWHLRKKRSLEFFQKELLKSQSNLNTIVHGFEMIGFTFVPCCSKLLCIFIKNSAKGTTDPRVKFTSQILIKLQFRNLDQALTLKSQPNISISTNFKKQNMFVWPWQIYLEYLGATKMRDKDEISIWNIWIWIKWETKFQNF